MCHCRICIYITILLHFLSILGITILQCSIAHEILLPFNSAFRLTCASKAHAENLEGATNFSLEATCSPLAHVLLVSIPLQMRAPKTAAYYLSPIEIGLL